MGQKKTSGASVSGARRQPPPTAAPTAAPPVPSARLPLAENEAEDFLLSSYDATCSLAPASAAALLSSRRAGAAGQPLAAGTAGSSQLVFCARYLPMGAMKAAEETGVAPERLRLPPPGSSPCEVYGGG